MNGLRILGIVVVGTALLPVHILVRIILGEDMFEFLKRKGVLK